MEVAENRRVRNCIVNAVAHRRETFYPRILYLGYPNAVRWQHFLKPFLLCVCER